MIKAYKHLYKQRFELYLSIQIIVLFGSLVFPKAIFENIFLPILYSLNTLTGILMISKNKKSLWFCTGLFFVSLLMFGGDMFIRKAQTDEYLLVRLFVYFIINIIVTWNIIKQVWKEKKVDRKVILGLISGYISLGFLGFFLFISIDLTHSHAFTGVLVDQSTDFRFHAESLLYYSFITLLTIGYGEIIPAIPIAQKAAILLGLIGQFYITIVTAIIVTKYINHSIINSEK
ncbi:ion channel [Tenacibaculum xiamenense]|uniref:ion channel n=1 Tax=Tenacibaculum xiamenense TaxID=1261553 RepID=UPI0038963992